MHTGSGSDFTAGTVDAQAALESRNNSRNCLDPQLRLWRLVSAAQQFLLRARSGNGQAFADATAQLRRHLSDSATSTVVVDAIAIRALVALTRGLHYRPSLLEQYVQGSNIADRGARFQECLETILTQEDISDPLIKRAVKIVLSQHADSSLQQRHVAKELDLHPSHLCVAFRRATKMTFRQYLAHVRLHRAAALLVDSTLRIKEVWTKVGYNHASDFDHHFRRHFGMSPTEYRRRQPAANLLPILTVPAESPVITTNYKVVVIGDGDPSCALLAQYLQATGYPRVSVLSMDNLTRQGPDSRIDIVLVDRYETFNRTFDIIRDVRASHWAKHCPAIILASDWDIERRMPQVRALNAGVLLKPCGVEDISNAIQTKLRGGCNAGNNH